VEFIYFNLKQLILESLELFRNSERWSEDLEIETNLNDSIILRSDPEQIKQVLWNLLLNAADAMPEGGQITICTDIISSPSENEKVRSTKMAQLMIRDTGPGFPSKILNNLFTPFLTTKRSGSGLGLAIVKRIVEGLDGKIQGKNHPDGGAEIEIQFEISEGYKPYGSEESVNEPN
jgi:two-component system sensor histidine kinase PilS (NtrC family)